jgi:hypothetical protein
MIAKISSASGDRSSVASLPGAPNLGSMPHPHCVTKFFKHRFKPGAVAASFQPYDHLISELSVEVADIILAMVELCQMDFAIGWITVSNSFAS